MNLSGETCCKKHKGATHWLVSVWTYGRVEVQFQHMGKPPFSEESKRLELLHRLNEIEGIDIPEDKITKRPTISLSLLTDEVVAEQFLTTLEWVIQEIRAL